MRKTKKILFARIIFLNNKLEVNSAITIPMDSLVFTRLFSFPETNVLSSNSTTIIKYSFFIQLMQKKKIEPEYYYSSLELFQYLHDVVEQVKNNKIKRSRNLIIVLVNFLREKDFLNKALQYGSLRLCQFIYSLGCVYNEFSFNYAVNSGSFELCRWLYSLGCVYNEFSFNNAVRSRPLELCRWLHAIGCSYNEFSFNIAVRSRSLELCRWLHSLGCVYNEFSFNIAVRSRSLKLCQWLHAIGCVYNEFSFNYAVETRSLKLCRWLHSLGCVYNKDNTN